MSKWKYDEKSDSRNYDQEARELLRPLRTGQMYELYEIVNKQLQKSVGPSREKELRAVKKAIEFDSSTDRARLSFILNGYKSEMAQNGHPKDGKASIHKKKA